MSTQINYSALKGNCPPEFSYVDTIEEDPRFLLKNHKFQHAKDSLYKVGGECRTEIVNGVWMLIWYKLGSFTGCIMDKSWRIAPIKFFNLMMEANILKQTLF